MLYYPILAFFTVFGWLCRIFFLPTMLGFRYIAALGGKSYKGETRSLHFLAWTTAITISASFVAFYRLALPRLPDNDASAFILWAYIALGFLLGVMVSEGWTGRLFNYFFGPKAIFYLLEEAVVSMSGRDWYKLSPDSRLKKMAVFAWDGGSLVRQPSRLIGPGSLDWKVSSARAEWDLPLVWLSYRHSLTLKDLLLVAEGWQKGESLVSNFYKLQRLSERMAQAERQPAVMMGAMAALYTHIDTYRDRYRSKTSKEIQTFLGDIITEMQIPADDEASIHWLKYFDRLSKGSRLQPVASPAADR